MFLDFLNIWFLTYGFFLAPSPPEKFFLFYNCRAAPKNWNLNLSLLWDRIFLEDIFWTYWAYFFRFLPKKLQFFPGCQALEFFDSTHGFRFTKTPKVTKNEDFWFSSECVQKYLNSKKSQLNWSKAVLRLFFFVKSWAFFVQICQVKDIKLNFHFFFLLFLSSATVFFET